MKTVVLKDRFVNNHFYCFYIFFNSILCFFCTVCSVCISLKLGSYSSVLYLPVPDTAWPYELPVKSVRFLLYGLSVMLYYYYAVFKMFYALSDHVFNASVSWLNFSIITFTVMIN